MKHNNYYYYYFLSLLLLLLLLLCSSTVTVSATHTYADTGNLITSCTWKEPVSGHVFNLSSLTKPAGYRMCVRVCVCVTDRQCVCVQ